MKKLLITVLLFFISGNVFGDNSINIPYKESIKQGVMGKVDDTQVPKNDSPNKAFTLN